MTKTARPRIDWVDHAKGVGIFLVVLGHVLRGLVAGKILPDGPAFRSVDSWIYSFHMPLFFLASGMFADRQVGRAAGEFARDKLAALGYPYLVWSVLQTLLQCAAGPGANRPASPGDLAWILVEPIMQFWFLYALLLTSLIYYALRRCGLGPAGALAGFAGFWATRGWASPGRWSPIQAARDEGIYYALGSVLNRYGWIEGLGRAPSFALGLLAALGYGAIAARVVEPRAADPSLALVLALCGLAASLALAVLLGRERRMGFVRVLGCHSLEIFLAHTIASAGIRVGLVQVMGVEDAGIHVVLGTLGGLAMPLALARLCRRFRAEFLFRLPPRSAAVEDRSALGPARAALPAFPGPSGWRRAR